MKPNPIETPAERKRRQREHVSGGMQMLFVITGSLFNLLALGLLIANIISLSRLFLAGQPITLGTEYLAPFGAFLAGIICFAIAWQLD
ncbi:MAG: hypothetical protein IT340_22945 [Chloroflexi bacterium]|nr:hypothetical protein [Chloroflexota bacterium]